MRALGLSGLTKALPKVGGSHLQSTLALGRGRQKDHLRPPWLHRGDPVKKKKKNQVGGGLERWLRG